MPYLNCPRCHLSMSVPRVAFLSARHCPRCIAKRGVVTPLFSSPLTMRELISQRSAEPGGTTNPGEPLGGTGG